MFNKSKKVIKVLNTQLSNLEKITNEQQGNTWKATVNDIFDLYIGPESSITKRLKKIYFTRTETIINPGVIGVFENNVYEEPSKENFKYLLQSTIKYVEFNGVYKNKTKNNFLSSFSNKEVIGGIVGSMMTIYAIGNYFGNLEKEREIIKFESTIEKQKKSLEDYKNKTNSLNKKIEELKVGIIKNESEKTVLKSK